MVLCFWMVSHLDGQNRWAFLIGVSQTPSFQGTLPRLQYAENDVVSLAAMLSSERCQFAPERIFVLTEAQARSSEVRAILAEKLSQTAPEDFVFFFFVGHGIRKENIFYLLLSDSEPERLTETALSLDHLASFCESYIPARHLFLCFDANRSREALSDSWQDSLSWSAPLGQKEVCIFFACAPYQIAQEKGGTGLFCHFLKKALDGVSYLNHSADENQDGLITVSELAEHLRWNIRLCGISQYPITWGKNDCVLSQPQSPLPALQIVEPKSLKSENSFAFEIAGFARFSRPITAISVEGQSARIGFITDDQARKLKTLPWKYTYWFAVPAAASPETKVLAACVTDSEGKKHEVKIALPWRQHGWYGEWMPEGMVKGKEEGHYIWLADESEMVYVPEGSAVLGISEKESAILTEILKEVRAYYREQQSWYENDYTLRANLIQSIEQSNEAVQKLAQKIQAVYNRTTLLEKVHREVSPWGKKASDKEDKKEARSIPEPLTAEKEETAFFSLSQKLLLQCYEDLQALTVHKMEIAQTISFLDIMIEKGKEMERRKSLWMAAFYMDRYEVTNRQYRLFCDATSRPYPPTPPFAEESFWQENYPAVYVSWEDAMAYSFWAGKRLPEAAQWEKCARGLSGSPYPWGEEEPDLSLVNADVPASLFAASPILLPTLKSADVRSWAEGRSGNGCYHMAGNVQEWVRDVSMLMHDQSSQLPGQEYRISKGGSFRTPAPMLPSWNQHPFLVTTRRSDLGFRCLVEGQE